LETKKYFPSPECEQKIRSRADREISAAAIVVAQAAESHVRKCWKLARHRHVRKCWKAVGVGNLAYLNLLPSP